MSAESRPAPSKRTSAAVAPAARLPPLSLHPAIVIANHASLSGKYPISIAENTVLHPYAKIRSEGAEVKLGSSVIVHEGAIVGISGETSSDQVSVTIGNGVSVESNAVVQAAEIGEGTVIGPLVRVEAGCKIGKVCSGGFAVQEQYDTKALQFCAIAPAIIIPAETVLQDFTIVYGPSATDRRLDTTTQSHPEIRERKRKGHALHIETLKKLIPSNIAKWQLPT